MPEKIRRVRRRRRGRSLSGIEALPSFRLHLPSVRVVLYAATAAAIVLLIILFGTYGSKLYLGWHESRLLKRAGAMLEKNDFVTANRLARQVLARHRDSLPAFYILAEATEKQNSEETVSWRAQIARLQPDNIDSQLNLASAALRFGQIDLARKTLERVAPRAQDEAAFHIVAGWLARAEGNLAEQEQQFDIAVNKDPKNDLYKFNLAALQIRSQDPEKSAQARANLERLTQVTQFRTGALRALLGDAVDRNDLQNADRFAQQLQMSPQVGFGDYLRLAYQGFAARQSRQSSADAEFDTLWRAALHAAADQPQKEINLARLATKWNLPIESEALWSRLSHIAACRREALDALYKLYRANNDLKKLYDVLQRLHDASPNEIGITANLARLGLNIDQNTKQSQELARRAYERAPDDVSCAVTYAFSLYAQGRTTEGLEILQKLPPEALHESHAAVYAAVLLLDVNQTDSAKEYIQVAKRGPIYAEEKGVLEDELAKIAGVSPSPTPLPSPSPTPTPSATSTSASTTPIPEVSASATP